MQIRYILVRLKIMKRFVSFSVELLQLQVTDRYQPIQEEHAIVKIRQLNCQIIIANKHLKDLIIIIKKHKDLPTAD